jgi:hypothetical protein
LCYGVSLFDADRVSLFNADYHLSGQTTVIPDSLGACFLSARRRTGPTAQQRLRPPHQAAEVGFP